MLVNLEKCLLHGFFGVLMITGDSDGNTVYALLVAMHEFLEGSCLSSQNAIQQRKILVSAYAGRCFSYGLGQLGFHVLAPGSLGRADTRSATTQRANDHALDAQLGTGRSKTNSGYRIAVADCANSIHGMGCILKRIQPREIV